MLPAILQITLTNRCWKDIVISPPPWRLNIKPKRAGRFSRMIPDAGRKCCDRICREKILKTAGGHPERTKWRTKDPAAVIKTGRLRGVPDAFNDWPAGWCFLVRINSILPALCVTLSVIAIAVTVPQDAVA